MTPANVAGVGTGQGGHRDAISGTASSAGKHARHHQAGQQQEDGDDRDPAHRAGPSASSNVGSVPPRR